MSSRPDCAGHVSNPRQVRRREQRQVRRDALRQKAPHAAVILAAGQTAWPAIRSVRNKVPRPGAA